MTNRWEKTLSKGKMQKSFALISYVSLFIMLTSAKPHLTSVCSLCLSAAGKELDKIICKDVHVVTAIELFAFGVYCKTEIKRLHNGNK